MSTSLATSLLRRAMFAPLASRFRSAVLTSPIPSIPSRSYVVVRAATKQSNNKAAVAVSTKDKRFGHSKVTAADANLHSVLDAEIDTVEQSDDFKKEFDLPEKFPFEIIDTAGEQTVVLKRELNGETIKVTVLAEFGEEPQNENDEEDEDEVEKGEEDEEDEDDEMMGGEGPSLSLLVSVDKGEGTILEVLCGFNQAEFYIENVTMKKEGDETESIYKYQGPQFSDLDESLQDAMEKYLIVRGIRPSLVKFLYEYMLNKDEREYLGWLKNMKSFVAKE